MSLTIQLNINNLHGKIPFRWKMYKCSFSLLVPVMRVDSLVNRKLAISKQKWICLYSCILICKKIDQFYVFPFPVDSNCVGLLDVQLERYTLYVYGYTRKNHGKMFPFSPQMSIYLEKIQMCPDISYNLSQCMRVQFTVMILKLWILHGIKGTRFTQYFRNQTN